MSRRNPETIAVCEKHGTSYWPALGDTLDRLERTLIAGEVSRDTALAAARVLAAYRHLVAMTEASRRPVVRALRQHAAARAVRGGL